MRKIIVLVILALFIIGCQKAATQEKTAEKNTAQNEKTGEESGNLFAPKEEAKPETKLESLPDMSIVNSTDDFNRIDERIDALE